MADVQLKIKIIEFKINDDETICNIYHESSEPDNVLWGDGWKTKVFPSSISVQDFLIQETSNYLTWNNGRK